MSYSHRTPNKNSTTGCYTTLLTAVAPILIYFLQVLGKISTPAACLAGVLIISKALIEWRAAMRRLSAAPVSSSSPKKPTLVRYHPPVAGCYFCQEIHPLRSYRSDAGQIGICQHCYGTLEMSRRRR